MTDQRIIRASFNDERTITVYQAYNKNIADAAVREQRLNASPLFKTDRMTWIKPSWCWMMYRCGFSYKDANQECVLALRMKHEHFEELLRHACLAHASHEKGKAVVVQWDPERGTKLEKLDYRSIQIGIPPSLTKKWIEEWVDGIENVTETARAMRKKIDENGELGVPELVELGLMPLERPYAISRDIAEQLGMI